MSAKHEESEAVAMLVLTERVFQKEKSKYKVSKESMQLVNEELQRRPL